MTLPDIVDGSSDAMIVITHLLKSSKQCHHIT